jgi:hypothetical protein
VPIDAGKATSIAFDPLTVTVERGRLRFFATATGSTDPVYSDLDAARQAGHPDLPVPPTFLFGLELESPGALGYIAELGIDMRTVLHGQQSFTYHAMAYAGDALTLQPRIIDVFARKGGALEFLVKQTGITRAGEPVADATSVLVIRHPQVTGG